ncbi:MAG: protein-disulfide reductase DsbD N-terminal domain-containing protein [Blastocatellia bacterium]
MIHADTNCQYFAQFTQAAALCLLLAACVFAQDAAPINPIKWKLCAETPSQPLLPGARLTLKLTAEIDEGWHLYSTTELERGPKPTRIALAPNQPFELADIESPEPRREYDQNFGIETEFYEQSVTFALPVQVKADAPAGAHKLAVIVRYQTCNEHLCLPPKLLKLEVEVPVSRQTGIRLRTLQSQKRTLALMARQALNRQS